MADIFKFNNSRPISDSILTVGLPGTGTRSFSNQEFANTGNLHLDRVLDNTLYQLSDSDLTSLAGATGTDKIYYRNASGDWLPVTIGAGLTFTNGTLSV